MRGEFWNPIRNMEGDNGGSVSQNARVGSHQQDDGEENGVMLG